MKLDLNVDSLKKKVKIGIWVVIVAFVAILIYQNQQFFFAGQSLRLNLLFTEFQSSEWKVLTICIVFFMAGMLLSAYFMAIYYLRVKRKKELQPSPADEPPKPTPVQEQPPTPEPAAAQSTDSETVVFTPDAPPPVTERQEP